MIFGVCLFIVSKGVWILFAPRVSPGFFCAVRPWSAHRSMECLKNVPGFPCNFSLSSYSLVRGFPLLVYTDLHISWLVFVRSVVLIWIRKYI